MFLVLVLASIFTYLSWSSPGNHRAAAAAQRDVAAGSRAPKVPEQCFPLPPHGDIRYNSKGFFRCHCYTHASCRRQRQSTPGRHGAGRPIGLLIAWLREADQYSSQADHVAAFPASREDRRAARAWFVGLEGSQSFLDLERPKTGLEDDDEPVYVP